MINCPCTVFALHRVLVFGIKITDRIVEVLYDMILAYDINVSSCVHQVYHASAAEVHKPESSQDVQVSQSQHVASNNQHAGNKMDIVVCTGGFRPEDWRYTLYNI